MGQAFARDQCVPVPLRDSVQGLVCIERYKKYLTYRFYMTYIV